MSVGRSTLTTYDNHSSEALSLREFVGVANGARDFHLGWIYYTEDGKGRGSCTCDWATEGVAPKWMAVKAVGLHLEDVIAERGLSL